MTDPIVVARHVAAPPAEVYRHLTESGLWSRWQGEQASVDPSPGGPLTMSMPGGQQAVGEFVELVPDRRVAFTWGWVGHPGVPPGSSTVQIDLVPEDGGTLVTLTHRDLPPEETTLHEQGWEHYLPRLASAAEGSDPGIDPGPGGDG